MIKPLYGFISDSVPLWGYRRRSYLAVCGLMGESCGLQSVERRNAVSTHWLMTIINIHTNKSIPSPLPLILLQLATSATIQPAPTMALPHTQQPGAASWLALAFLVHSPIGAVAAMLLGSLSTAASDVVVDSIVVERARGATEVGAGLSWI